MEKALEGNKILERLVVGDFEDVILPGEFCHHILLGTRRNTSLSEVDFGFHPDNWDCPNDGRLVYVRHILCDSVVRYSM